MLQNKKCRICKSTDEIIISDEIGHVCFYNKFIKR